jgi:hypothetical protein
VENPDLIRTLTQVLMVPVGAGARPIEQIVGTDPAVAVEAYADAPAMLRWVIGAMRDTGVVVISDEARIVEENRQEVVEVLRQMPAPLAQRIYVSEALYELMEGDHQGIQSFRHVKHLVAQVSGKDPTPEIRVLGPMLPGLQEAADRLKVAVVPLKTDLSTLFNWLAGLGGALGVGSADLDRESLEEILRSLRLAVEA